MFQSVSSELSPDVLTVDDCPECTALVRAMTDRRDALDVEAVRSMSRLRERVEAHPPALLLLPVDDADGDWTGVADAVRESRTTLVLVDTAGHLSPDTAVEAGATDYIHTLPDSDLPLIATRLTGFLNDEPADDSVVPRDVWTAGLVSLDDFVYVLDTDGRFRWWNQRVESTLGRPSSALQGQPIWSVVASEERTRLREAIDRVLDGDPTTIELAVETSDGERIPYELDAAVVERPHWNSRYVFGIGRDVSERTERNRALTEVTRQMKAVTSDPRTLVAVLDPEGRLRQVNETALQFGDVAEASVLGEPFWETPWWTHSAESAAQLRDAIERARRGAYVHFETTNRDENGEIRVIDTSIRPVTDDDGTVTAILAEGIDITKLTSLQAELDETMGRISDALFSIDERWKFTYLNERALNIADRPADELLGEVVWGAFPTLLGTAVERHLRDAMARQEPTVFESFLDVAGIWAEFRVYPSESGLSVYARDVSDERERDRQLKHQREQLAVLDRILRHDIRTHATVIRGYAALLKEGDIATDVAATKIDTRLSGLLSTAEKTRQAVRVLERNDIETCSLQTLLDRIHSRLEARVDVDRVSISPGSFFERTVRSSDGLVLAFVELLENAVRYSNGSDVVVDVGQDETRPDQITIRILDDGPGIPKNELRVLEGTLESPVNHSFGIGIWLARWLVEAHDGLLQFVERPEGGTETCIVLPALYDGATS